MDKQQVVHEASWLAKRMKEPSTWAGLGMLLGTFGFAVDPVLGKYIAQAGVALGGIMAFFLPE